MAENSRALIPILVTMMLVTGVCNTILNKYQVCHCLEIGALLVLLIWDLIGHAMC